MADEHSCIYCQQFAGATKDHVPPKGLLCRPLPANLVTVPSCLRCNEGVSADEEYFRLIVVGLMCHTKEADELFDNQVSRSMDRREKLSDQMFGSLRPIDGQILLDVDYVRIFRVVEKIARGLEFAHKGIPYDKTQRFAINFGEVDCGSEEREYGPDFSYKCLANLGGWEFTLYDSVRFTVRLTTCSAGPRR
jgi:hypothetical protein